MGRVNSSESEQIAHTTPLENFMSKTIFTKTLISASLLLALSSAQTALAAEPAAKHQKHNVVSRQSERVKTDNGFTRTTNKTDDQGESATRRAEVAANKEAGTRIRNVSGTTFEGKHYSGQSTAQKTDTGYASEGQLTTANGKVIDRSVNAQVDKEANTVTKDISVTPANGETKTRSVVRPLKRNKE
jgi:hypothetical protein